MTTFTDTEAGERLAIVLDLAKAEGEVRIRGVDGSEFVIRPVGRLSLDVGFVKINPPVTAEEIVSLVREGRDRG